MKGGTGREGSNEVEGKEGREEGRKGGRDMYKRRAFLWRGGEMDEGQRGPH